VDAGIIWTGVELANSTLKIPAPPWTDESPERLFALFFRYQVQGLTGPDFEEYAGLLLSTVANYFSSNQLMRTLPQAHLDPMDVAQDAVIHLLRKTKTMTLRSPCWRVLLACINTSLYHFVATQVNTRSRKFGREMCATDYYVDRGRPSEEASHEDPVAASPTEQGIFAAIRAGEGAVIGDIPIVYPSTIDSVERLFRHIVTYLAANRALPSHAALPPALQKEVSLELHALVISRVIRFVRDQASDH
jgi:hypothetical protein